MAADSARSGAFQDAPQLSWVYMSLLYEMRPCDDRDDFAERLENGWHVLQVAESDNSIGSAVAEPDRHNQIMDGLLFKALTRPNSVQECFSTMSLNTRDIFRHVIGVLNQLINEKLHRLQRGPLDMLMWIIGELMKNGVDGLEDTWYWLLRRLHGGDLSEQNLKLAAACLRHLELYQDWLAAHDSVVIYAVFKFMRLVLDHADNRYSSLRNTEVKFCTFWIQKRFDLIMPAGKEFIRFLLQVRTIPEFDEVWQTLLHNPRSMHPDFPGVESIINQRAPSSEIYLRILPLMVPFEVEQKLKWMLRRVPQSPPKVLQDWFLRLHLSRPESESLRADIFRLVVVLIHPSNDVLRSDAIKRWQFLTTLLNGCTTPVHTQLCMLSLFYDWLDCVENPVYIMLAEPGMLMINYNLERNAKMSFTLLDFIIRLSLEFYPPMANAMVASVQTAFRYLLKIGVVSNLFPVFNIAHPLVDARLRLLMKIYFMPFIDPNLLANEAAVAAENGADNSEANSEPSTPTELTSPSFRQLPSEEGVDENMNVDDTVQSDVMREKFADDDEFESDVADQQNLATTSEALRGNIEEQLLETSGSDVIQQNSSVSDNSTRSVSNDNSNADELSSASYWMTDDEELRSTGYVADNLTPQVLDGFAAPKHTKRSIAARPSIPSTNAVTAVDPLIGSMLDNSGHFVAEELIHSLNMHALGFTPQFTGPDAATECVALARKITEIKRVCSSAFSSEPAHVTANDNDATANLVVDKFCEAYQSTPYLTLCAQLAVPTQTDLGLCRIMRQICAQLAREKFPSESDGEDVLTSAEASGDEAAGATETEIVGSDGHSSTTLSRKNSSRKRRKLTAEAATAIHNVECIGTMCSEIIVDRFYSQLERSAREQLQQLSVSNTHAFSSPANTNFVQSAVLPLVVTSDSMRRSVQKPWFVPMRMLFDWGTAEEDNWSDLNENANGKTDEKNSNGSDGAATDTTADDDMLKLPSGPQTERILQRFLAVMNKRFPLLRAFHLYYLKYRRDRLAADDERDVTVDYENFSEECALLAGQIDSRSDFSNVSLETALYHDLAMCAATDVALFGHLLPFVCRELFAVFRNDAKMIRLIVRNCDPTQISQLCYEISLSIAATSAGGGAGNAGGRSRAGDADPDAMLLFSVIHPKPQQAFQGVIRQAFDWSPHEQTFLWDLLDAHQHIATTEIVKGYLNELKFPCASQMVFLLVKRLKRDITAAAPAATAVIISGQHKLPSDACLRLVLAERRFIGFDAVLYSIVRNWCDSKLEQASALAETVAHLFETLVNKSMNGVASSTTSKRGAARTISQGSSSNENGASHYTELENFLHNLESIHNHYRNTAFGSGSGRTSSSLDQHRGAVIGGEPIMAKLFANDKLISKAVVNAYRNIDVKLRTAYLNLFECLLHNVPRHLYEGSAETDAVSIDDAVIEVAGGPTRKAGAASIGNKAAKSENSKKSLTKDLPDTIEVISDDDDDEAKGEVKSVDDHSEYLNRSSSSRTSGISSSSTSKRDTNNSAAAGIDNAAKKQRIKKPSPSSSTSAAPAALKQMTLPSMLKKQAGRAVEAASSSASVAGASSKPKKRKKIADSDDDDDIQIV